LLTRLLVELAALPPEQREAIAALLAPQTLAPAPAINRPDDRLPWERKTDGGMT
jgi:hypothetical protein